MKKLSLLLLTVLISVTSFGQSVQPNDWSHLNPFAYDLKSEVKDNGTIDLIFSLNANAIPSDGGGKTYEKLNENRGVQIYILDEHETVVHTILVPTNQINKGTHTVNLSYNDIPEAYWGKPLSWEVTVWGNKGRTEQKQILDYTAINTASGFYPKNVHGIAIEKNPNNPHFGKIFISEACTTSTPGKNSLLEYDMLLKYQGFHHKDYVQNNSGIADSHFSKTVNYEPHRVKISEDGRIFVTCYHPTASHAVLEYMGSGIYKSIIKCKGGKVSEGGNIDDNDDAPKDWDYGPHEKYNRRPIAMDVIGRGNDLKIIVAWISPKGWYPTNNKGNWRSQVEIIEYAVGENGCDIMQDEGTTVATWKDKASSDDYAGYLFQQYFNVGTTKSVPAATHGFVDISYDNDGDIWLKVDYAYNANWVGEVYLFKREENDTKKEHDYLYSFSNNGTLSYGANGICIIKNKNDQYELFTGSATDQIAKFTINKNTSPVISNMKTYTQTADGSLRVVGIAEDYAGNLYFLNNRGDETKDDNVVVFAMPYDGKRVTRSQTTFNVSAPIPNILATDLRFAPVPKQPKYRFSFNVNTTPKSAQIRFYKSYGDNGDNDMKKNLAYINADDYQGGDAIEPSFVYNIPEGLLKQGEIAVEFDMVGGEVVDGVLNDAALPRGEWYWSVYVEAPRKSSVFAPIYRLEGVSTNTGQKDTEGNDIYNHERRHATVNNYPETDMFGSIIVAHNPSVVSNDNNRPERGLKIYGINPNGNDEQSSLNNNTRYHQTAVYLNGNATSGKLHYPRRMAVAPDGKIYIADEGSQTESDAHWKNVTNGHVMYTQGGVKLWDPANPDKFTLFSDNKICLSTGVALWDNKLYATNTYNEYAIHFYGTTNYTKEQQENPKQYGWNGFVEYTNLNDFFTTSNDGTWENFWKNNERAQEVALYRGDASGNNCLVAMDKGIWICQHREHTVKIKDALQEPYGDNIEAYVLSFVPYDRPTPNEEYGPRTWRSSTTLGVWWSGGKRTDYEKSTWSQTETSPLQSTPGAGLAYKAFKDKDGNILKDEAGNPHEYLYVVNHDGNIVVIQITQWTGNTPSLMYLKTLVTPAETKGDRTAPKKGFTSQKWHTAFITSMNFDYAGNLVTTTGKGNHDNHQDIIVYTMQYDRVNAREIQAPNSCRYIPERVSYLEENTNMGQIISPYLNPKTECYVDIYRPMPNTSFSTICLPFDLDIQKLGDSEPYYEAEFKQFTRAEIVTVSNEKILELQFSDIPTQAGKQILQANTPYIVKPKSRIPSIVKLQQPIQFVQIAEKTIGVFQFENSGDNPTPHNSISFTGVIPTKVISAENVLLLVAENRLAEMVPDDLNTNTGKIHGFRGYFTLGAPLPQGMQAILRNKDNTVTGLVDINGKKVNINKYLREGRVYIRMGDTLYTIDGQKVE